MATKLTSKYQTKTDVNPKAVCICGRTGINKPFEKLTDDDIAAIIAKGSQFFEPIPAAAAPATPKTT